MDGSAPASLLMLVAGLGFGGGVLSGLLGIGGGILMTPLLLFVPVACRLPALDMQTVAGLTIVQSLFAGLSGLASHRERGNVHFGLALWLGGTMVVTAFGGAWWSRDVSSETLLALFAGLAVAAACLMLVPAAHADEERGADRVSFGRARAVAVGIVIGFTGGMVGQSGAFMVVPATIHFLRVPVRTAIGTTLAVVVLAALAGTAGKLSTGQVVLPLVLALVPPTMIGARIGARWSGRLRPDVLRRVLALVIAAAAMRICYELLTRAT
ncbi:MAG: sulfite exporter TauE/SafE family protein [Deltaproteobacteria bacterium]|nr:sulfite exporter TauE/SafE family protein [Deltaproteobacteria bacterium]